MVSITCPNCNAENQEGVNYCDECGTKLGEAAPATSRTVPAADAPAAPAAPASSSSGTAAQTAKLVITRGGTVGKEFPLEAASDTHIGRWDPDGGAFPEIDLTQDDPEAKISRRHARVVIQDGQYAIEDVGSLNGTYVNRGARLMPGSPQALKNGDEVVMGKTFFKFIAE